jgi:prepilin-type N-terminal cleavage/methylation domain-containing protein
MLTKNSLDNKGEKSMRNPALLKTLLQFHQKTIADKLKSHPQSNAGFTLLEFLVVVIIIAVLSAIAAPGWLGFVSQRRANAANEVVLKALQQAQTEARSKKVSYSVSFRRDPDSNNNLQIAVYPTISTTPSWKNFGQDIGIKPGQVTIGTNLSGQNTAGSSISYDNNDLSNPDNKITFDYMGALPLTAPSASTNFGNGLIVVVAATSSSTSTQPIDSTRRCVKVATLLGSIRSGKLDSSNECVTN